MTIRFSNNVGDSSSRALAHRLSVRTFSRTGVILKDIRARFVALGIGKGCNIWLVVSRKRFRGAHRHRLLIG